MADHKTLAAALAAFQAELPTLKKGNTANAGTYTYKYADLADVSQTVLPLLGKHGLSFSAKPTIDDGKFVLAYSLRHEGGEHDDGAYPLPTGAPQQVGSAITYARRYALSAMTGIAPDADDDGASAPDVPEPVRERTWDPTEQEELLAGYSEEIRVAKSLLEISAVGRNARKRLSPASLDHLSLVAAERKAELNGGAA